MNNYTWDYRPNGRDLALINKKTEQRLATIATTRNSAGRITHCKFLTINTSLTNIIDLFDKVTSAPGLTPSDQQHLFTLRRNFFLIEGPIIRESSYAIYAYADNPEQKQEILAYTQQLKQQVGRLEYHVTQKAQETLKEQDPTNP